MQMETFWSLPPPPPPSGLIQHVYIESLTQKKITFNQTLLKLQIHPVQIIPRLFLFLLKSSSLSFKRVLPSFLDTQTVLLFGLQPAQFDPTYIYTLLQAYICIGFVHAETYGELQHIMSTNSRLACLFIASLKRLEYSQGHNCKVSSNWLVINIKANSYTTWLSQLLTYSLYLDNLSLYMLHVQQQYFPYIMQSLCQCKLLTLNSPKPTTTTTQPTDQILSLNIYL